MNPLDFTYLLPRHLNISSSFCPSVQLWSQWQDKRLLHTLHPHYQGSHSSVLWVMSTHRCLVRCGTMFGGQYHECRLRTGTSANICSLSALAHMWEGCSSDCKEVSWKKKKNYCESPAEDVRLTGSTAAQEGFKRAMAANYLYFCGTQNRRTIFLTASCLDCSFKLHFLCVPATLLEAGIPRSGKKQTYQSISVII